ncbi:hypothetical protein [Streptomyces virginiae]|uniref:hypothetical protein n=1 Tax=Streptomyces virginiae TaxID=1961 RepID=UPI00368D482B
MRPTPAAAQLRGSPTQYLTTTYALTDEDTGGRWSGSWITPRAGCSAVPTYGSGLPSTRPRPGGRSTWSGTRDSPRTGTRRTDECARPDRAGRIGDYLAQPELAQVTAGLYIGDRPDTDFRRLMTRREDMRQSPPDLLITNYKLLDLLLQRSEDRALWQDSRIQYVVLGEERMTPEQFTGPVNYALPEPPSPEEVITCSGGPDVVSRPDKLDLDALAARMLGQQGLSAFEIGRVRKQHDFTQGVLSLLDGDPLSERNSATGWVGSVTPGAGPPGRIPALPSQPSRGAWPCCPPPAIRSRTSAARALRNQVDQTENAEKLQVRGSSPPAPGSRRTPRGGSS